MAIFKGSGVAVVTPMHPDGSVHYEKLAELIDFHIDRGTDALIICGTTGEASTLHDEEHKEVIRYAVAHTKGRLPVIAGTGSNDTAHAIMMSRYAESVGVDGLLLVTPYYNKTTQRGLLAHYRAIADAVKTPIILYNVPGRTGVNIAPETVATLAEHPQIVAVKEASGNISQVAEIARVIPEDFALYSGNDDMIVPLLSLGGDGVISVVANILPTETHDMVESYLSGDINRARQLQLAMKPLIDSLFIEVNPIPVKTAMNLMGFGAGPLRLPLYEMAEETKARMVEEMKAYGLETSHA